MSGRPRGAAAALLALAVVGLTASPALAHAEIDPTEVEPGAEITLTITSIVEREALINTEMQTIVPRQWETLSCAGPATWSCAIDEDAYAPHTLVTFAPVAAAIPADIRFSITVRSPETATGAYLFRTLQTHADGWVEPWVYDGEPYIAPRVTVGGNSTLINGDGTAEDPACFGPSKQPADYGSHDGAGGDTPACVRPTQASASPSPAPAPSSEPTPSAAPLPRPSPLPSTGSEPLAALLGALVVGGAVAVRRASAR